MPLSATRSRGLVLAGGLLGGCGPEPAIEIAPWMLGVFSSEKLDDIVLCPSAGITRYDFHDDLTVDFTVDLTVRLDNFETIGLTWEPLSDSALVVHSAVENLPLAAGDWRLTLPDDTDPAHSLAEDKPDGVGKTLYPGATCFGPAPPCPPEEGCHVPTCTTIACESDEVQD